MRCPLSWVSFDFQIFKMNSYLINLEARYSIEFQIKNYDLVKIFYCRVIKCNKI